MFAAEPKVCIIIIICWDDHFGNVIKLFPTNRSNKFRVYNVFVLIMIKRDLLILFLKKYSQKIFIDLRSS